MIKKYKHIKLPNSLIKETDYERDGGRDMRSFNIDFDKQKKVLNVGSNKISNYFNKKIKSSVFDNDKDRAEIFIEFIGPIPQDIFSKYGISIYKQNEDNNENQSFIGSIKNKKLPGQDFSDFEKFKTDLNNYTKGRDGAKKYFQNVKEIKPLTFNEIVEKELKKELKKEPNKKLEVDISFSGKIDEIGKKIDKIQQEYQDNFISKINDDILNFCRISANFKEIQDLTIKYSGIDDIEKSPKYASSNIISDEKEKEFEIETSNANNTPVIIFDGYINKNHPLLKDSIKECFCSISIEESHATAVSSLVVYGMQFENGKTKIIQENSIIPINIWEYGVFSIEKTIEDFIEKLSKKYEMLIVNLSINNFDYEDFKNKLTKIDKLTVLIDRLANKYNCLFVNSIGNLFDGWDNPIFKDKCLKVGYPNHFNLFFSRILAPSNSINNISVGSISLNETLNSVCKKNKPSAHTRSNFDNYNFVKPDFVYYDSNSNSLFDSENNGVYFIGPDNKLHRGRGTSFSTPLITNILSNLHNKYPKYTNNTLKALLIHFSENIENDSTFNKKILKKLTGFGIPNIDKTINSFNYSSTIVIEDVISVGKKKIVPIPIPSCISGSQRKRLKIYKTLVYNPIVNPKNPKKYNPINIYAQLVRDDGKKQDGQTTKESIDGAHQKSNVKKTKCIEVQTLKHTGINWGLEVCCEAIDENFIKDENYYNQKYSVVITLEDINKSEEIDLHQDIYNEITNMVTVEVETSIELDSII